MEGKTHILTAMAFYSALNVITKKTGLNGLDFINNAPDVTFVSLGSVLIGSIMPDVDMPGSTAGSKITLVNMKMVKLIVNVLLVIFGVLIYIFSGNKYALYGGSFILLMSLLLYKSLTHKLLYILRRIVQIIIVLALVSAYVMKKDEPLLYAALILVCYFFSKHRGISHTLILSIVSAFCVYTGFEYYGFTKYSYIAAAYFFAGCFLHIFINDYITDKGVPNPIYPLSGFVSLPGYIKKWGISKKAFKEGFKIQRVKFLFTISTGATGEVIFSIACIAVIVFSLVITFMR